MCGIHFIPIYIRCVDYSCFHETIMKDNCVTQLTQCQILFGTKFVVSVCYLYLSFSSVVPDLLKSLHTGDSLRQMDFACKQQILLSRGGSLSQGMLGRQRAVPGFNFSCPPGLGHSSYSKL